MEWNDILSQIDFDESLSETEEISLRNILEDAYKRSSILRNYFSQFFARTDIRSHLPLVFAKGKKDICKHEIDKEDKSHYYRIELKLDSISSGYISEYGIVIKDSKASVLIHELCHALLDTHDNWIGDPNYTGENIRKANLVYEQLGITKQLSYPGISSSLQIGYSYTKNSKIDTAFVCGKSLGGGDTYIHDWSSPAGSNTKDLIIVDSKNNNLWSDDGNDFLY